MNTLTPLYFAHANGFPAEVYQELFDYLAPHFSIHYLPMLAHAHYRVSNNWPFLVNELIENIKSHGSTPVIGVGHSMGGVLIYMAACIAPQLFQQIILLDAPLLNFWRSQFLRLMKLFSLMHYVTPINRVRNRRVNFSSQQEALDYFQHKALFQDFTQKSLELYVQFGLNKTEGNYQLRFDRETETRIFATIPDNLFRYQLPKNLPRSLIYSTHSKVVKNELTTMQKKYNFNLYPMTQGSHLFPFEYPKITAEKISAIVFNLNPKEL